MHSFSSILFLSTTLVSLSSAAVAQPSRHGQGHHARGLHKRKSPCKLGYSVPGSSQSSLSLSFSNADVQNPTSSANIPAQAASVTDSSSISVSVPSSSPLASSSTVSVAAAAAEKDVAYHGQGGPGGWNGHSGPANGWQSSAPGYQGPANPPVPTTAPIAPTLPISSVVAPTYTAPTVPSVSSSSNAYPGSNGPSSFQPAAISSSTASYAAPAAPTASASSGGGQSVAAGASAQYQTYSGWGDTSEGWPAMSDWLSWEQLWANNLGVIKVGCGTGIEPPSDTEISDLKAAILAAASASGLDARFILAIVMQESKGCPRVITTNWGVNNPGLMQSHNGQGTCNSGGQIDYPCPNDKIVQMINDGVMGGDGSEYNLKDDYAQAKAVAPGDAQAYYVAGVAYNRGSIPTSHKLEDSSSTKCYGSDIANRLRGWFTSDVSPCPWR